MTTHQARIELATTGHRHMHDITGEVAKAVRDSGITTGTAHVFNIGSTAVVGTIEYEQGLEADLPALLDRLIPPSTQYGHERAWHDGNGHSHLQASWLGPEITVPVTDGALNLGTWQQIFHLECDIKPRNRKIIVTVMGE
jgi:secondary thiamine-phosphate synthase enzyme